MLKAERFSPTLYAGQCLPPHIASAKPDVLKHVLSPRVNLSLWKRSVQPEIMNELSSLKASSLSNARCETSPETFDDDIYSLMKDRGLDPGAFQYWRKDLRRLADNFFGLSQDQKVLLRLETFDKVRCPRFHVDHSRLRLLCTYRGQSTEWLTEMQADRVAQTSGASNKDIIRFGKPSSFGVFSVGVMKGSAYPENADHGLVHRSPSIEGPNQTRVLFCLDC